MMTSSTASPRWLAFGGRVILYLFFSVLFTAFSHLWLSASLGRPASLVEIILLVKSISLFLLIIIGGDELYRAERVPSYLRWLNRALLVLALFAGVCVLLKMFIITDAILLQKGGPFYEFLFWVKRTSEVVSILPLVCYAVLNLLVAFFEGFRGQGDRDIAKAAASYFAVADVPCVVPIFAVFALVWSLGDKGADVVGESRVFLSGAMAMFILASNLLSISVRYVVLSRS